MGKLRRPLVALAVVLVVVVVAVLFWRKRETRDQKVTYRTAPVERQDVELTVSAVGALEPLTTVDVKANVAGEIVELAVDRGDLVKPGDLIARIDPTESRTAWEQAQANLDSAMGRVRETTANLRQQETLTPEQVRAAQDSLTTAETRIKQSESALVYQRQSTATSIRRSEQALASSQAQYRQTQSALTYQRDSTATSIRRAEQALAGSQAQLRQAEAQAGAQPELSAASVAQAVAAQQAAAEALQRLKEATQPQERAAAKATLEAAEVTLANSRKAANRLVALQDKGYVAAQNVEDAQTKVAAAQQQYDSAQATYDSLAEKQATDLREAQARVGQANAALRTARAGESQVTITEQQLEAARAAVREAEAALDAARAGRAQDEQRRRELEAAAAGVRESQAALDAARAGRTQDRQREQELETARASAEEAQTQVRVALVGMMQPQVTEHQVEQAKAAARGSQAQLTNAAKNLQYATVTAPRAGLVIDRLVEQGTVIGSARSSVSGGQAIVTIADVSRMFVNAEVDEADIGRVRAGQTAKLTVDTFPDTVFEGRVTQVYPKGEVISNVTIFRVRIEVENAGGSLRPAMTAEASILAEARRGVLAVPSEAIIEQRGEKTAQILVDGLPQPVPVKTGLEGEDYTEVVSGLTEGQQVILNTPGQGMGPGGPGGPGGPKGPGGPSSLGKMSHMMEKH